MAKRVYRGVGNFRGRRRDEGLDAVPIEGFDAEVSSTLNLVAKKRLYQSGRGAGRPSPASRISNRAAEITSQRKPH